MRIGMMCWGLGMGLVVVPRQRVERLGRWVGVVEFEGIQGRN